MGPDDLKRAWQAQASQARLTTDADLLVSQVRRDERRFNAMIFRRNLREVGVALVTAPVWIVLGVKMALPWTWYLAVPAMLWIAGCMLVDLVRHRRQRPEPGDPLCRVLERSLAQVEQQIRLLRGVLWWYLLPLAGALLAFFGQVAWEARSDGVWTFLVMSIVVAIAAVVFASVYRLNLPAVSAMLVPRRRELETLLASLAEEPSDTPPPG